MVQALIAFGSGGAHGLGFAQGKQKLFFLPFAHSDFIFAVIGEELGLAGGWASCLSLACSCGEVCAPRCAPLIDLPCCCLWVS